MSHPEPVPHASQLAVLPFLAAMEGFFRQHTQSAFRLTMHRISTQANVAYFQQLCTYLGTGDKDQRTAGRLLPITAGIIGHAYKHKKIARTKRYPSREELTKDLREDMKRNQEAGDPNTTQPSYLAIPFIGRKGEIVLVLYADAAQFNFFADDQIVNAANAMCHAYAGLLDWLQVSKVLPTIQNFPLEPGAPMERQETVYKSLQEVLEIPAPQLKELAGFNYEATVP